MGLPNIKFNIATNGLGRSQAGIQKIPGLVITGVTEADVTLGESYQIFSLKNAEDLGMTNESGNAFAYKHITDFYETAGQGAPLWFMLVSDATTMTMMGDVNEPYAKKLINEAGGAIRVLGLVKQAVGDEAVSGGLDEDVATAVEKAQGLVTYFAERFMHIRAILSGNGFNGTVADLTDFESAGLAYNGVSLLIANNDGEPEASIGLALGKQLSIPSQRKQSRIKDGPVITEAAFFTNGDPVESLADAWDAIDDKGYTFFRNFANRSGYFFTSDITLTAKEDDFSSLARGFVMDEAVLIAYGVLIEQLSDEIPVTEAGLIHPAIIKSWQSSIETQIENLMVANGKLVAIKAFIDENQNVLSTDKIVVGISLLPVGYAEYIEVNIGFTTNINE